MAYLYKQALFICFKSLPFGTFYQRFILLKELWGFFTLEKKYSAYLFKCLAVAK